MENLNLNNKMAWLAAAALLVVIGLLIWLFTSGAGPSSSQNLTPLTPTKAHTTSASTPKTGTNATANPPVENVKVSGIGPLATIAGIKDPLRCSVTATTNGRSGTLYASGGVMRINFTNAISMIDDGMSLYAWKSGGTTGLKVPNNGAGGSAMGSYGALDPATTVRYSCYAWSANTSVFTPPASVTF